MVEVVSEYEALTAEDGSVWTARVCTRQAEGALEELDEFTPIAARHAPMRTPIETTQPNLGARAAWASGLTLAYLKALRRAHARPAVVTTKPAPRRSLTLPRRRSCRALAARRQDDRPLCLITSRCTRRASSGSLTTRGSRYRTSSRHRDRLRNIGSESARADTRAELSAGIVARVRAQAARA